MSGGSLPLQASGQPPAFEPATSGLLLATFQDAYRQELAAEEDVHRTLPFFATALGLLIAAVNYAAGQLPPWPAVLARCPAARRSILSLHAVRCAWPELAGGLLMLGATVLGAAVLGLLALATKRRRYDRVGPEDALVARTQAFQAFHSARGLASLALDDATAADLRMQMLQDYAAALPHNRALNLRRYVWRGWAVFWLLWSLLSAIAATIIVVLAAKFDLLGQGMR